MQEQHFNVAREILRAITYPNAIRKAMEEKRPLLINRDAMENFLRLTHKQRVLAFDSTCLKNFAPSEYVGQVHGFSIVNYAKAYATKNFAETVYLPFEKSELPLLQVTKTI